MLSVPTRKIHYAWVVFAATFVTLLGASAFRAGIGVLIDPLHDQFGWTRGQIGVAMSINLVLYGLVGPYAAALMTRYGVRRVVVTALVTIGVGALLTSRIDQLWQLYLTWGVMIGGAAGFLASTLSSIIASRWFVTRRGLVTGIMSAGMGSGQLIALPVLSRLAGGPGWRWVGIAVAIATLSMIPIVVLFLRDSPEQLNLRPYGAGEDFEPLRAPQNPLRASIASFRLASSSRAFWLLMGSFGVCGLSTNGLIQTHFISASGQHGITHSTAAGYLALVGVFDVIGTVASGVLTDRVDPRKLLCAYYLTRGFSLLVLHQALSASHLGVLGFIVFYGLDWVATVPPTVALCNELFGRNDGPLVYGWTFTAHQLGAALAAWGAGWISDHTGSYHLAFVLAGAACVVAAIGVLQIRRPGPLVQPIPEPVPVGGMA